MLHALSTLSTYLPTIVGSTEVRVVCGCKGFEEYVVGSVSADALNTTMPKVHLSPKITFASHRTAVSAASSPDKEIPWVIRTCDQPAHDGNQLGLYHFKRLAFT
jgi:hypothetical protein